MMLLLFWRVGESGPIPTPGYAVSAPARSLVAQVEVRKTAADVPARSYEASK